MNLYITTFYHAISLATSPYSPTLRSESIIIRIHIVSQTHMLDEAAKNHPDSWWWIKADGCDLIGGLSESTRGVWSGDVNLNDGVLEQQLKVYQERLSRINDIKPGVEHEGLLRQLTVAIVELKEDLVYLQRGTYVYDVMR